MNTSRAGVLLTVGIAVMVSLAPTFAAEPESASWKGYSKGQLQKRIARLEIMVKGLETALRAERRARQKEDQSLRHDLNAVESNSVLALDGMLTYNDTTVTALFSGVNVQVVNGLSMTNSINNLGNLIVGYDAPRDNGSDKSGSHNLVVGDEHNYSSYAGFLTGFRNSVSGTWGSVSGGWRNIASGPGGSVCGGTRNIASGHVASVTGGLRNTASSDFSSVSGGSENMAQGDFASVSGGRLNTASGEYASVSGGRDNTASGDWSSVSGGGGPDLENPEEPVGNVASGLFASISGGTNNRAKGQNASISGGNNNVASGGSSSVSGGEINTASGNQSSVTGGASNVASGNNASVTGGDRNTSGNFGSSVSGGYRCTVTERGAWGVGDINTATGCVTTNLP